MKNRYILFFLLIFIPAALHAKPLTLENGKEIHRANQLILAMDEISEKVMACIQTQNGSKTSCTCPGIDSCKFKSEFIQAASLYCNLKHDFPKWANQHVIYSIKGSDITHAFSMGVLEQQYGKHCK